MSPSTYAMVWIAAVATAACTGFSSTPQGASDRVVAAPGAFTDPPAMRPSDQAVRTAVAPQGVQLVGSADLQPHRTFDQPVLVRVPTNRWLPPGMPVFSLELREVPRSLERPTDPIQYRWDFTRRQTATDGGDTADNLPLLGWVDETGANAWIPTYGFSDHGPGTTEASPIPLTRIGEDNDVKFVCNPYFASGVWIGPPIANIAGVRFSGRPFRTAAFRRAWEDIFLHSAATPEEAQAVSDALDWMERRFNVTATALQRTTESPWMLGRFRSLWGEYRAHTRTNFNRGTWKFTTLTNTAARVESILERLNALRDGTEIARDAWGEFLAHATAMGVADARIANMRRVFLASPLARDSAAVTGFDDAVEAIESRQRNALEGNLRVLLAVAGRAATTAATIELTALATQGFKTVAQNLGRSTALMAVLAQDLFEGNNREAEARATLCAHSNIQLYSTWANLDGARDLARDRDEIVLASQELMARGARSFLRGEASSLSQRAIYASLTYAWPTLQRGMEQQQRYFSNLEETSRTELQQLVAQRMSTTVADPDAVNSANPTICITATTCDSCMDIAGCSWCGASTECVPADAAARGLTCESTLVSTPAACTTAPAPVPPAATDDPCRRFANDCRRCVAESGCGFCQGACRRATTDGTASADGVCRGVGWTRLPSACGPVPQPPLPRCPCWAGFGNYCQAAAARYAAEHTCQIPSELLSGSNVLLRCAAEWTAVSTCSRCIENDDGYPDRCASASDPLAGTTPSDPLGTAPPTTWTMIAAGSTVGSSVRANGQIGYRFPKVSGRRYRVVMIPGGDAPGTGDVDLYAGGTDALSLSSHDCRPFLGGTSPEVCSFTASDGGQHYVLVHAPAGGSFTLSVFEQGGPAPSASGFDPAVNPPSGSGWYDAQPFMTDRHLGADLNRNGGADADLGSVVFAMADGVVGYAADAGRGWNGVIILRHEAAPGASFTLPDGGTASAVWSLYGHVDRRYVATWLTPGDVVRRGQPVGIVGPTPAGSSGPHLHLEVRTTDLGPGDGYADSPSGRVNPITFLTQN